MCHLVDRSEKEIHRTEEKGQEVNITGSTSKLGVMDEHVKYKADYFIRLIRKIIPENREIMKVKIPNVMSKTGIFIVLLEGTHRLYELVRVRT